MTGPLSPRVPPERRRFKQVRAAVCALGVAAAAFTLWPRPDDQHLAHANGQVLRHMLERYATEHRGAACADLGTLVTAAETGGYNVRVRNPYSGVFSSFDDPAIARPLFLRRGSASEAGVVFYQTMPDALGRVEWLIQVSAPNGKLHPVRRAEMPAITLAVKF